MSKGIILQLKIFKKMICQWSSVLAGWQRAPSLWVDGFMLRDSHLELGRKAERGVFARQDAGWRGGVDARSRSCTAWLWCMIYHGTSFSLLFFFFFV